MPPEENTGEVGIEQPVQIDRDTPAPAAKPDAAAPEGSPPADKEPKSALEAVTAAFAKQQSEGRPKSEEAVSKDASGEPGVPHDVAAGEGAKEEDLTAGKIPKPEWDALPASTKKRITQFRERVSALDRSVTELSPKARTYDELTVWMGRNALSQEDFVGALEVAALLKSDPLAALKRLSPIIEQLRAHAGETLPADLQKDVADGVISAAHATELARLRAEDARLRSQVTARTQADVERDAQASQAAAQQQMVDTVRAWEGRWKASDPDYAKKSERVWERMVTIMSQKGLPQTPEASVALAEEAKKHVETWLDGLMPAKRPMAPVNGSGNAANTVPVPQTALDAVKLGLARANAN